MPWRVETPMSQRQDFVETWVRDQWRRHLVGQALVLGQTRGRV